MPLDGLIADIRYSAASFLKESRTAEFCNWSVSGGC